MNSKLALLFVFSAILAVTFAVPKPRESQSTPLTKTSAAITYSPEEIMYHPPASITYPLSSSRQVISRTFDGVSAFVTATPVYFH